MAIVTVLPKSKERIEGVDLKFVQKPGNTYKLDWETGVIEGMTDKQEALRQAIYLILNTPRYEHEIYSRNYGVELSDLIGMPTDYAVSVVRSRISEALLQDDRIKSVDGWEMERGKNKVMVKFTVHSIYGDVETSKEVSL